MKINKLAFVLSEDDLSKALEAAFQKMAEGPQGEMLKSVSKPKIALKDGHLFFKCNAKISFMPVPVEAKIRLAPAQEGKALEVELAKLSMAMMGGDMIAGQMMGQLATALAGKPGISVTGNTLTIGVEQLAALRGITLGGKLNDISIVNGMLEFDFS